MHSQTRPAVPAFFCFSDEKEGGANFTAQHLVPGLLDMSLPASGKDVCFYTIVYKQEWRVEMGPRAQRSGDKKPHLLRPHVELNCSFCSSMLRLSQQLKAESRVRWRGFHMQGPSEAGRWRYGCGTGSQGAEGSMRGP